MAFCPSFHNMLFDRWLACRLKDEGSFLKNLGRGSMRGVEASRLMAYGGNECSDIADEGLQKKVMILEKRYHSVFNLCLLFQKVVIFGLFDK